jgi:hypothetical protein
VPKRMPSNAPNARHNSCGHYVILTNLARPERISRGWIHKHPWRIVLLRSFSVFLQNDGQIRIHRQRLCGTFRLGVRDFTDYP